MGYPIQAIHVPKTVDNDLPITDCCPGFGSVAKYVAVSALEASFDVRSMAKTSDQGVRARGDGPHAGWIAAAGGLIEDEGIPVVVLFPEIPFDEKKFTARVEALVKEHGYCTVIVSEGCTIPTALSWRNKAARMPFGHAQLGGAAPVVAACQAGAGPQVPLGGGRLPAARRAPHRLDHRRAAGLRARRGGGEARAARAQRRDADHRAHQRQALRYRIGMAPLTTVANVEKFMPRDFITADGFGITEACKRYLRR
jgi:6-phosphofructokinase 1